MDSMCIARKNLIIVKLSCDLDHHVTEAIRSEIDMNIDNKGIKNIAFDFKNVSFMDSSGIGLIMGRYKRVMFRGGKAAVTNVGKETERIFNLSGLFQIIERYATPERAVAGLNAKKDK